MRDGSQLCGSFCHRRVAASGAPTTSFLLPAHTRSLSLDPRLGYSYEPDEYDRRILQGALSNSCSMGHSFWHTTDVSEARRTRYLEADRARRLESDSEVAGLFETIYVRSSFASAPKVLVI
jgi:hypothetical protein